MVTQWNVIHASYWKHGVQHENNPGLSEGSGIKMSKIYTHKASIAPKVKNPTNIWQKAIENTHTHTHTSTISKLVNTKIHKPRYESTWFYNVNARKYHEITLIWWVKDVGIKVMVKLKFERVWKR